MSKSKIDSISIENFRVFRGKSEFKLAPITILTGANSSGKSSIIKSLKLLQNFWNNLSDEGILDFSVGTHELGDFENVLPYNTEKKEITISYTLSKHILFGELYVENVFNLDDSRDIKNGKLIRSSLYQQNDESVLLYEIKYQIDELTNKEKDIKEYYLNIDTILNTFVPRLKKIVEQRELFLEKCPRPHKTDRPGLIEGDIYEESFGDYIGKAFFRIGENVINVEDDEKVLTPLLEPVVNQKLCDYMGLEFEVWEDMKAHEGVSFLTGYPKKTERELFKKAKRVVLASTKVSNKYNSEILDLISCIPLDKYDNFEEELWLQLSGKDSEVAEQIGREKFHYIVAMVEDEIKEFILKYPKAMEVALALQESSDWKTLIRKYDPNENDFISLFQQFEKEEIKNISHITRYTDQIINFSLKDTKAYSLDSVIFHSILFYSALLDKRIFNLTYDGFSASNIEKKIPLLSDIQEEMERVSYKLIESISGNMSFVDAIRANVQRFYTFSSQGTSFNHILLKYLRQPHTTAEKRFLEKWIKEFEIGDDVHINKVSTIGAEIWIQKGDQKVNLIDMGYGVTPFLALLLNIISSINEKSSSNKSVENTIIIEEPEVSLHPKLQSKLADFFWDAHKEFSVNFIIETHSEYLIRKLQYLTARGDMETDDTVLHYIDNPTEIRSEQHNKNVKTIYIKSNGQLTESFGSGFTDESMKWVKEMFPFFNQK